MLLGVDQNGVVHLLHLLFSVPVDVGATSRSLFAFEGEFTYLILPLVTDIPPKKSLHKENFGTKDLLKRFKMCSSPIRAVRSYSLVCSKIYFEIA